MTTESITIWVCNAADCDAKAPERADGWYDGIHTHACPGHAGTVAEHKATVSSSSSGRGSRAITRWYLTCSCGWVPSPSSTTWNYGPLTKDHLAHLRQRTMALPGDQPKGT
jgi:hypothetical protein